jgi:hypothetical protein
MSMAIVIASVVVMTAVSQISPAKAASLERSRSAVKYLPLLIKLGRLSQT